MTKELHKADMKRFKLTNKFLKSKIFSERKAYTLQSNFCKQLLRNIKKNIKKVTDNHTFLENCCSAVFYKYGENKSD